METVTARGQARRRAAGPGAGGRNPEPSPYGTTTEATTSALPPKRIILAPGSRVESDEGGLALGQPPVHGGLHLVHESGRSVIHWSLCAV